MCIMEGMPPIGSTQSRVLILGSFPSAISLEKGQYYGNGKNHFWDIMGLLLGEPGGDMEGLPPTAALVGLIPAEFRSTFPNEAQDAESHSNTGFPRRAVRICGGMP